jgi:hypothetical protein
MEGLGLTVVLLAMTVWAYGNRVMDCVFAAMGELVSVMHFKVWCSIRLAQERR